MEGGLDSKFKTPTLRNQCLILAVSLKITPCEITWIFKKEKEVKIQNFISKTNLFFWHQWAMLAMWLLLGVSKNARKMILQPISNIELSQTHTQLELDMHGVAGKLMKDVVHLWRENFEGKKKSYS